MSVKDKPSFQHIEEINPFFEMMPASFRIIGVVFATLAAIIASQALISGSYTLVSEAIKLNLWPRLQIIYPTNTKGQLYIPVINSILWAACIGVVLYFRTSEHMEAAYGLAITITMLMTTILLYNYLIYRNVSHFISLIVLFFFGGLETMFFLSSATKLFHGGFVTVLIALIILSIMVIWHKAYVIEHNVAKEVSLVDHVSRLEAVKADYSIPLYATNLVYLTSKSRPGKVDSEVMYSIFDKQPKRAEVYWFINVEVTDEPRTMEYVVENFGTDSVIKVKLRLGFRMEQKISTYMRQVVIDLMKSGDINKQPQKWSINEFNRNVGDFCFVIVREELSTDTELSALNRFIMQTKLSIKKLAVSPVKWFGLEYTDVKIEHVPLLLGKRKKTRLKRVYS